MKKLLAIIIVGVVFATVASYFAMQWRVKKAVDNAFISIPMIDARYDKVSLDMNGKLAINKIEINVPMANMSISIGQVAVETSGLFATLGLEKSLENGELPEELNFSISNFNVEYTQSAAEFLSQTSKADKASQMLALGCGRNIHIGPQQLYDMGIRNLTFDLGVGYVYNMPTDEVIGTIDLYLDGIGHLVFDQTVIGLGNIMSDFGSIAFGFDPNSIITRNLHIDYTDLGYYERERDYCARESGREKAEYEELHLTMLNDVLSQIGFEADFDFLAVYEEIRKSRSNVEIDLRPMPGFEIAQLGYFNMSELIDVIDLRVSLNSNPIDISYVNFDQEKWSNLRLVDIRRNYRVGPEEKEEVKEETGATQERILKEVPISDLEKYLHRHVSIQRKDGQVFRGELTGVTAARIIVRTRLGTGFTDLPLSRGDIKTVKLYPEN